MTRSLSIIFITILCQLGLIAKPFHVYSPSSKENTLWLVKATPKGENLKLEVAEKVNFDFSGRVITAHPIAPLTLRVEIRQGAGSGRIPQQGRFLPETQKCQF